MPSTQHAVGVVGPVPVLRVAWECNLNTSMWVRVVHDCSSEPTQGPVDSWANAGGHAQCCFGDCEEMFEAAGLVSC